MDPNRELLNFNLHNVDDNLNSSLNSHVNDDDRALESFVTSFVNCLHSSIRRPLINTPKLKLEPIILQLLNNVRFFKGHAHEDPNVRLINVVIVCVN